MPGVGKGKDGLLGGKGFLAGYRRGFLGIKGAGGGGRLGPGDGEGWVPPACCLRPRVAWFGRSWLQSSWLSSLLRVPLRSTKRGSWARGRAAGLGCVCLVWKVVVVQGCDAAGPGLYDCYRAGASVAFPSSDRSEVREQPPAEAALLGTAVLKFSRRTGGVAIGVCYVARQGEHQQCP